MPLIKSVLEKDIYDALMLRTEYGKKKIDPAQVEKKVAKKLASAIHSYIKSAMVIVDPGIATAGSPMSQTSVSPGKGKLM